MDDLDSVTLTDGVIRKDRVVQVMDGVVTPLHSANARVASIIVEVTPKSLFSNSAMSSFTLVKIDFVHLGMDSYIYKISADKIFGTS